MKTYAELKGPGAITLEIADDHGKVVLQFPKAVESAVLDPGTAILVAEAMVKAARRCGWAKPVILFPWQH